MNGSQTYVIVGAGLAGVKAAEALRSEGSTDRIVLIGEEPHHPYERPPLSKSYLQGAEERASVFVHAPEWFVEQGIEVRLGVAVTAVDRVAGEVALADGARVGYDALLLATGSRPRRLEVPGADLAGVRYLRTLDEADALKASLAAARRVAVIGGGWIGLEVAAAARLAGREVTVIEQAPLPLQRALGPEVAAVFADLHREHGVDLRCDATIGRFLGTGGALVGVELADGTRVDADLAVVGVGIIANTEIAQACGLDVSDGIRVDQHLRTSDPRIYAAGDVADAHHPILGRHIRVEHWANALRQGPVAARSMLGLDAAYTRLPFFYTDQYDLGMEYIGYAPTGSEVLIRGDVAARRFVAFWTSGDRVLAGMHVNVWDATEPIEDLILSGREVDVGRLADADIPIAEV
ncbi:MAG: FAD-dependent oxidoreductase [Candidatus Nanopelagicales bacterium]